jgi:hypothetical protein
LTFVPSVAVIVRPTPTRTVDHTDEDRKLRLQYKPAWLCRHEKCRHVRLVGRTVKREG